MVDMRVPDHALKTVAFVGIKENDEFIPKATGFFVSYEHMQHRFMCFVTAEHVISGLITRNNEIFVRINLANGDVAIISAPNNRWHYYPSDGEYSDVAVIPLEDHVIDHETGERIPIDCLTVALNGERAIPCTSDFAEKCGIGIGDEIFIVGLFRSHFGNERNRPIARGGRIAAMLDEPVFTKYAGYIDAYLIEAMSIGGLSGSPVFVHLPPVTALDGRTVQFQTGQLYYLLGLMHGHFDVQNLNEDVVADLPALGSINTGIGVVIPVEKIIAAVTHPDLEEERRLHVMELRKQKGAEPDLTLS
jgi:hypothetical protein